MRRPVAAGVRFGELGSWPGLREIVSAVRHEQRPRDKRGGLVRQEQHAGCDFLRGAAPAARTRRGGRRFEFQLGTGRYVAGATTFTVIPSRTTSRASALDSPTRPAFAEV